MKGTTSPAAVHHGEDGARESQVFVNKTKNMFESMDFEEVESVMWRKVWKNDVDFRQNFSHCLIGFYYSISCEDTSKREESGGTTHDSRQPENGFWLLFSDCPLD